jgi:hypothetical protein
MRLVRNSGTDRGVDSLRAWLTPGASIDVLSPFFSLFAFAELRDALDRVGQCRLLLGEPDAILPGLFGGEADIASRGALQGRWLGRLRRNLQIIRLSVPIQSFLLAHRSQCRRGR